MHRSAGLAGSPPHWAAAAAAGLLALACAAAGAGLALVHPLWPLWLVALFAIALAWMAWRPAHLMLALPAALPWLDFSPWTGRQAFSEFDLLVLACAAGAHARWAGDRLAGRAPPAALRTLAGTWRDRVFSWAAAALLACSLLALWRGVVDAGGWSFTWWPGYADAGRAMLLFKPMLWLALLLPPVRRGLREDPQGHVLLFCRGMCIGAAILVLAVLWERAAMPGLQDFTRPYRAVGLFWEMHVGGAAIDAYLAMAAPFVGWALHRARQPLKFTLAALLALGFAYACLTTFSRGVYGAVLLPVSAMGALLWLAARGPGRGRWLPLVLAATGVAAAVLLVVAGYAQAGAGGGLMGLLLAGGVALLGRWRWQWPLGWRQLAGRGLAVALVVEVLAVAWLGSFLADRVRHTERDFGRRMEHWSQGLRLMHSPSEKLLGIGLGRLPPHLARFAPRHEFSGTVTWSAAGADRPHVRLAGPASWGELAGLFALTQRVPLRLAAGHRVAFDIQTDQRLGVALTVCELHLLYERHCQGRWLQVDAAPGWQHQELELRGPALEAGPWWAPRQAVLLVALTDVGASAQLTGFRLSAGDGQQLLRNGDFGHGLDHWLPLAQSYFLPWHIDNLYLELLIERGPLALLAFVLAASLALVRALARGLGPPAAGQAAHLALGAGVFGLMLIGGVSSVMDTGRPAFLALGLVVLAASVTRASAAGLPRGLVE